MKEEKLRTIAMVHARSFSVNLDEKKNDQQYGLLARAIIDEVKLKRAKKAILLEF